MALHTSLPIYKVAYDLLDIVTDLVKNMPRDFKQSIGGKINQECVEIVVLVFRANCATLAAGCNSRGAGWAVSTRAMARRERSNASLRGAEPALPAERPSRSES